MELFVKLLIAAPVFVLQYQINCLKNSWHKVGKETGVPISAMHEHTDGVRSGYRFA